MGAIKPLRVSDNGRYLTNADGKPFFWLGDTAWLLPEKLNREDAALYLDDRCAKGFDVVQVVLIHDLDEDHNAYGCSAVDGGEIDRPRVTPGNRLGIGEEYDYWDHVEWFVRLAGTYGIHVAMVPLWGTNVRPPRVTPEKARSYGQFLGRRLGSLPNIVWVNGGDVDGSERTATWDSLARGIRSTDPVHLMTFHPRGRLMSSMWFHNREWLDFNMVQSGHRRYDQDDTALGYGEDNWRYIEADWNREPPKPTLDAEPSYEDIPQGLHDLTQPRWTAADVRRYAYWSVFAGGCGFTYGHNSVIQFHVPDAANAPGDYGATESWKSALSAAGAKQMQFLRRLIESREMADRRPAPLLIAKQPGERYDHQVAARGNDYAFIYTWNGKTIRVRMGELPGRRLLATWFDPRDGITTEIGAIANDGVADFDPPGEPAPGNDWVLILELPRKNGGGD